MSHDHDANYKCDDDQDQALVSNQPADDDDLLAGLVLNTSGEATDEEILGALADEPRQWNGSINAAAPPLIGNKPDTGGQDEVVASADPPPTSVPRPGIPNYGEMAEANRIARKQRKDTNRQRRHRAKKEAIKREPDKARLDALLRATARSRGNKSWVQLRGVRRIWSVFGTRWAMRLNCTGGGSRCSSWQTSTPSSSVSHSPETKPVDGGTPSRI
jgi:hypothetical protein